MIYVSWERPRQWRVRVYRPYKSTGGTHTTLGIVALSVDRAIAEAQRLHPEARIESCHDCGEITSVVDVPEISL